MTALAEYDLKLKILIIIAENTWNKQVLTLEQHAKNFVFNIFEFRSAGRVGVLV